MSRRCNNVRNGYVRKAIWLSEILSWLWTTIPHGDDGSLVALSRLFRALMIEYAWPRSRLAPLPWQDQSPSYVCWKKQLEELFNDLMRLLHICWTFIYIQPSPPGCCGYSFFLCSLLYMLMFFLAFACFYFNLLWKFRSVHFTLSFPHSDLLQCSFYGRS